MSIEGLVGLGVLFFVVTLVAKGVRIVRQGECIVIERLGKFHATLNSGFNVIIPVIDAPRGVFWVSNGITRLVETIDLRETVLDIPEQAVITKDNVAILIDALLYIQITDVKKVAYMISNLPLAVAQLAQTSLRNVIGEMDLDETLSSRDTINAKLKLILDEATDKWGTKVNRVELRNITPPVEIQSAMEKQMQAERQRRAIVLEAEGEKQARIQRSEGQQQEQINLAAGERDARILNAEGESGAIVKVAEAKKSAIQLVSSAFGGNAELTARYLIATHYLESFEKFTQKAGDKVFLPYEASTALASFGSVGDLLKQGGPKQS
jgi:regulator of protease activity HflC (stomatin/prohibitin superfamily)